MRITATIEYLLTGAMLMTTQTLPAGIDPYAVAQNQNLVEAKTLTFENKVHDFGRISESDGPQTCIFKYRNNTDVAIVIQRVIVSCACTQADWSEKPVKPGESGEIKILFSNRIGKGNFDKSISVFVSSSSRQTILRVKGTVTEPEQNESENGKSHFIGDL